MTEERGRLEAPKYPWSPAGDITANFAIFSVRESLLRWLTVDGRIHGETLLTVIGSLAGMAAQDAALNVCKKSGEPLPDGAFMSVQTNSGETFYFGDAINGFLVPQAAGTFPLWSFVAGALVGAGVPPDELPDVRPIFKHAAATVGSPEYEILQVSDEHQPHVSPRKALELFWLPIAGILGSTAGPGPAAGTSVANEHWIIVLGLVAHQYITMTKDMLDSRIGASLIMGAAIIASKFDRRGLKLQAPG